MAGKTLSADGLKELKESEGSIPGLYEDQGGYCTFGVGHLVDTANKWPCFLLSAAKSDTSWKTRVKKKLGVEYLPGTVASAATFSDLNKKAVDKAKETMAKKKHGKEFAKLAEVQKTTVTKAAEAALKVEKTLLSKDVDVLLSVDILPYGIAVNGGVTGVSLVQKEFDALVSFAFNVGITEFKSSNLLKKINENKYRAGDAKEREKAIDDIEKEFAKWNKTGGRVSDGLIKRRKNEAAHFLEKAREELKEMKKEKVK